MILLAQALRQRVSMQDQHRLNQRRGLTAQMYGNKKNSLMFKLDANPQPIGKKVKLISDKQF